MLESGSPHLTGMPQAVPPHPDKPDRHCPLAAWLLAMTARPPGRQRGRRREAQRKEQYKPTRWNNR